MEKDIFVSTLKQTNMFELINKQVRKNIGRIRIPSTVLRSRSILPLSLSHEILEEEQLYSWGGAAVFLRRSSCILEEEQLYSWGGNEDLNQYQYYMYEIATANGKLKL